MANPTTNFGWQMPTSSDLVTDLPADFEVFGQAVDTALVDLKGGTTGQVLSKTSNTDMDFTWVTTDDANAIQNAIVDAKGDLIAASAADTPARLAVGSNGETLVADSSTATGLRYQVPANVNPVLNSAFQIWQRGTSIGATGTGTTYGADRWQPYRNAVGATMSRQVTGDTTNLPFIQYCARISRDNGNTSTAALLLDSAFESVNSIPYAGKTVTFSFYARAGANYSATSSALVATLFSGTGTDQNSLSGFTGTANVIQQTATLTTTWQRFTYSGTVGTTATQLGVRFSFTPTGTAGANDYYEVTGVQLEVGSVATPFKTYAGTIQGELAACQRYYVRYAPSANNYAYFGNGTNSSTTNAYITIPLPVEMRVLPTSVDTTTAGNYRLQSGATAFTLTSLTIGTIGDGTKIGCLSANVSSGLTTGGFVQLLANFTTSAFVGFSAEL